MQNIRINRDNNSLPFINKCLSKSDKRVGPIIPPKDKTPSKSSTLMRNSGGCHHAQLGKYAVDLWKGKSMTDVLIVVQGQEFRTHKAVLACYSPYFSEVLVKPGFSNVHYLHLPSVSARAFGILLEFMYTGRLRVTCQELNDVYRAAKKLGMKDAMKKCIELLQVTPDNFQNTVYLFVTASKLNLADPSGRAFRLMREHFERLVATDEFLDLELEQVLELLKSDEIGARSEIIVFLAALKWLNHRYLEREEHIVSVFTCIRFPLMSMEEIVACYHPPVLPGITNIPAVRTQLLNATCYIAARSVNQEHLFRQLSANPRTFLYEGEPMVLWDVAIFDQTKFQEMKRIRSATMIQAAVRGFLTRKRTKEDLYIANCAATVIQSVFRGYYVRKAFQTRKDIMEGGSTLTQISPFSTKVLRRIADPKTIPSQSSLLYVMGAYDTIKGSEGHNGIFKFDAEEMDWELVTNCPVPLHDVRMLSTSTTLFIIGGHNPLETTITGAARSSEDCYQYQFDEGKWTHLPAMNHSRSLHGAAVLNGMVLAIGGRDDEDRILSSIEQYNSSTNKWEEFEPSLPEPRMGMGVASDGSSLWIAGGISSDGENFNLLDSVWCFSRDNARWIKTMILPEPIAFPSLLYNQDEQLILVGGVIRTNRKDKSQLESVDEVLFLDGDEWTQKTKMPEPCHSAISAIVGKNIFVFGGLRTQTMSQKTDAVYFEGDAEKWKHLDLPKEAAGFVVALAQT